MKQNVKGAEFDNVAVLLGRGWSAYDFAKVLEAVIEQVAGSDPRSG